MISRVMEITGLNETEEGFVYTLIEELHGDTLYVHDPEEQYEVGDRIHIALDKLDLL